MAVEYILYMEAWSVTVTVFVCVLALGIWLSSGQKSARERFYAAQQLLTSNLGQYFVDPACLVTTKDGSMYTMRKFDGLERHPTITNACVVRDNSGEGFIMRPSLSKCKAGHEQLDKPALVEKIGTEWVNGRTRCVLRFKPDLHPSLYDEYESAVRDADFIASDVYQMLLAAYHAAVALREQLQAEHDSLEVTIKQREQELAALNAVVGQLRAQLSSLNAEVNSIQSRNSQLAAELTQETQALQRLTNEYNRIKSEYDNQGNAANALSGEISRLNTRLVELSRNVNSANAEVRNAQAAAQAALQNYRVQTDAALRRIAQEFGLDVNPSLNQLRALP